MPEESFKLPPSYREVADLITDDIDSGLFPYGTQLPSTAELAVKYGASEPTVQRAVKVLIESGDLVGRQGLGRWVTRR